MVVSFALFVLAATGTVQVWQVFVLAAVMGVRNAVDMPTRQAFAVEMVGREDIGNAVALNSAMFNGARVLGPAIAGLVIGAFGVSLAFLIDGVSFLAVLFGLFLMHEADLRLRRRGSTGRPRSRAVVADLAEGLRYVRRTGIVLLSVTIVGVVATFGINFTILIPPLAQGVLHVGAEGYGFLMAASGLGSLLAALTIAFGGTKPTRMLVGGLVLGVAEVAHRLGRQLPARPRPHVRRRRRRDHDDGHGQHDDPAGGPGRAARPGHGVYLTVFAGTSPIGGLLLGGDRRERRRAVRDRPRWRRVGGRGGARVRLVSRVSGRASSAGRQVRAPVAPGGRWVRSRGPARRSPGSAGRGRGSPAAGARPCRCDLDRRRRDDPVGRFRPGGG